MKPRLIILGAGESNTGQQIGKIRANWQDSFLDWQLHLADVLSCEKIDYVAGYRVEEIPPVTRKVHFHYNPDWHKGGPLTSLLLLDFDLAQPLFVLYGDVLIKPRWLKQQRHFFTSDKVTFFIDSSYPERYGDKIAQGETLALLKDQQEPIMDYDAASLSSQRQGEFVGLVYVPAKYLGLLRQNSCPTGDLSHLIAEWCQVGVPLQAIETANKWCDLNVEGQLARFVFCSKAETLANLEHQTKLSVILPQLSFTRQEWRRKRQHWLAQAQLLFTDQAMVVRSSAAGEDSFSSSKAGAFLSLLGISTDENTLATAIERVFASYAAENSQDEVLLQRQLNRLKLHAVVHTRNYQGGPYYVLNYCYGEDSEALTAGLTDQHHTVFVHKSAPPAQDKDVRAMLEAVKEIEKVCLNDILDLELGIDHDQQVYALQIRPLVLQEKVIHDPELSTPLLFQAREQLAQWRLSAPVWGVMPDWNPAEMIGRKPKPLAASLYGYIITDSTWAKQRHEFGYHDLRGRPLMRMIAGSAFIDVAASFRSFIPADLPDGLQQRILSFCLERLVRNPEWHDKVEFSVIPTCYRFDFDHHYRYLVEGVSLSPKEQKLFSRSYLNLTRWTIKNYQHYWLDENCLPSREPVDGCWQLLEQFFSLLNWCRYHGAFRFAALARCGFVAMNLLDSLENLGILSTERRRDFFQSLNTVSRNMSLDALAVKEGRQPLENFIFRYGHLRPGSYDITSLKYDEQVDLLIKPLIATAQNMESNTFSWNANERQAVEKLSQRSFPELDFNSLDLFLRESICGRELSKFVFTRYLSRALELLVTLGAQLGLNREQLSFLSVDDLRRQQLGQPSLLKSSLLECSDRNRQYHNSALALETPALLSDPDQLLSFSTPASQPNYVTHLSVEAPLRALPLADTATVTGYVVLLESADPGFDWIFTQRPAGLITLYGGCNSHMAIRCAEFQLPAAIGVGESLFQHLHQSYAVLLDCAGRRLVPMNHDWAKGER